MGIFRTKNNTSNDYVSNASTYNTSLAGTSPNTIYSSQDGNITYYGDSAVAFFDTSLSRYPTDAITTDVGGDTLDWWDIAQSHFFTVQIYSPRNNGVGLHDEKGEPFNFSSGQGTYKNFIPLKSMNFNYTSYDNMNIPFGIFGDLPILHKKKVTSISFSCYDIDQDAIEKALRYWEQQCFPGGMYVAYLEDVAAELKYTSYDVKGRENFTRVLQVIPASTVSVSRSYEENAAKLLNFSVVAVGAPGASANNGEMATTNVIKQKGYGDINERANRSYNPNSNELELPLIQIPGGPQVPQ